MYILSRMMSSAVDFLSEYVHRNVCESGFSADKGRFGVFSGKKEKTDNKPRTSQTLFSTISTQKNKFSLFSLIFEKNLNGNLSRKK